MDAFGVALTLEANRKHTNLFEPSMAVRSWDGLIYSGTVPEVLLIVVCHALGLEYCEQGVISYKGRYPILTMPSI